MAFILTPRYNDILLCLRKYTLKKDALKIQDVFEITGSKIYLIHIGLRRKACPTCHPVSSAESSNISGGRKPCKARKTCTG